MHVRFKLIEARESWAARLAPASWKFFIQALVIVVAGFCVYWHALQGGWLLDDDVLITDNYTLRGLHGLLQIWSGVNTTDYWPLSSTLLWVGWQFLGNDPLGYHLCSLALHLCSGFLIWHLFSRLGLRWGWLGGLIFVIHPLAVESVAWISEIKNTLSLPLFLLACDAWLDAGEKKVSYLRPFFYYVAAMLAKTSTVMLPAVILLYSWWKGGVTRQDLKRITPYFVVAIALSLVTIHYQNLKNPIDTGFITRLTAASAAVFFYLGKFFLPIDLSLIYPGSVLGRSILQTLSLPILASILVGLWTKRRTWGRHVLLGFGFFLLNLVPVLGVVKMNWLVFSPVADHFVYLPMIGLIGLVVAGLEQLHKRFSFRSHFFGPVPTSAAVAMGLALWQSHDYARLFNSNEMLLTYTLKHNPEAWLAHTNLGISLAQTGHVAEAIEQFEHALKINPHDDKTHYNLGTVLYQAGHVSEAIEQYEEALKINGRDAKYHNNLGIALAQTGHSSEAIAQFEQALKINPRDDNTHYNLGTVLQRIGRFPEAAEQFDQALKLSIQRGE